ncbi:MAG: hypothetical protein J6A75_02565 [Lachnospiraceae bacterium]|nr:hypothetical protein [Lachnospiraceae bacterium]
MSKAILVMDMPSSCSKCKFMYEFYGVKKCQLLNILENGGKAIISTDTLTTGRKECCPLKPVPEKKQHTLYSIGAWNSGYNACIDEIVKGGA